MGLLYQPVSNWIFCVQLASMASTLAAVQYMLSNPFEYDFIKMSYPFHQDLYCADAYEQMS